MDFLDWKIQIWSTHFPTQQKKGTHGQICCWWFTSVPLRGLQTLLQLGQHVGALCICGPVWVHTHRSPPELEAKKPLAWPTMTDNFGADIFSNLICLELRWWVVVVDLYDAARDFSGHFQGKAGGEIHGKQAEAEYPLLWTIGQLNDFFAVRVSAQERKETSWSPPTLLRSR